MPDSERVHRHPVPRQARGRDAGAAVCSLIVDEGGAVSGRIPRVRMVWWVLLALALGAGAVALVYWMFMSAIGHL